jgi:hypothetical protein
MDFEWLNESPPSDWTQDGHKLMKQVFPLSVFKKKSAIVDDPSDTWKSKLDRWGNAQPRKYRHFASPPVERTPMVIIVCNKPDPRQAAPATSAVHNKRAHNKPAKARPRPVRRLR